MKIDKNIGETTTVNFEINATFLKYYIFGILKKRNVYLKTTLLYLILTKKCIYALDFWCGKKCLSSHQSLSKNDTKT